MNGRASIRLALTDIAQGDRMIPITTDTFTATANPRRRVMRKLSQAAPE